MLTIMFDGCAGSSVRFSVPKRKTPCYVQKQETLLTMSMSMLDIKSQISHRQCARCPASVATFFTRSLRCFEIFRVLHPVGEGFEGQMVLVLNSLVVQSWPRVVWDVQGVEEQHLVQVYVRYCEP